MTTTKQVPMNDKQAGLISSAFLAVKNSREQRDLDVLLEGMASGLEGRLVNCDTDARVFNVEIEEEKNELAQ